MMTTLQRILDDLKASGFNPGSENEKVRKHVQRVKKGLQARLAELEPANFGEMPKSWHEALYPLFMEHVSRAAVVKESSSQGKVWLTDQFLSRSLKRGVELDRMEVAGRHFALRIPYIDRSTARLQHAAFLATKVIPDDAWIIELESDPRGCRERPGRRQSTNVPAEWQLLQKSKSVPPVWQSRVASYWPLVKEFCNPSTNSHRKIEILEQNLRLGFSFALVCYLASSKPESPEGIMVRARRFEFKRYECELERCGNIVIPRRTANDELAEWTRLLLPRLCENLNRRKTLRNRTLKERAGYVFDALERLASIEIDSGQGIYKPVNYIGSWRSELTRQVLAPFTANEIATGTVVDLEEHYPPMNKTELCTLFDAVFQIGGIRALAYVICGVGTGLREIEFDRLMEQPKKYMRYGQLQRRETAIVTKTDCSILQNPTMPLVVRALFSAGLVEEPSRALFCKQPHNIKNGKSVRRKFLVQESNLLDGLTKLVARAPEEVPDSENSNWELVDLTRYHRRCFRTTCLTHLCQLSTARSARASDIYEAANRAGHSDTTTCAKVYATQKHSDIHSGISIDRYYGIPRFPIEYDGHRVTLNDVENLFDLWLLHVTVQYFQRSQSILDKKRFWNALQDELQYVNFPTRADTVESTVNLPITLKKV
jgi:hypothetical protein